MRLYSFVPDSNDPGLREYVVFDDDGVGAEDYCKPGYRIEVDTEILFVDSSNMCMLPLGDMLEKQD